VALVGQIYFKLKDLIPDVETKGWYELFESADIGAHDSEGDLSKVVNLSRQANEFCMYIHHE
jgi:hypothetical protein